MSPRLRGRAAFNRNQKGVLGGEVQTSGLPWLSSVKTFALHYKPSAVRAGCGLCQPTPSQRSAKILVSLCVVRQCLLCFCRLAMWDGTPVPTGSPPFLPGAPYRCPRPRIVLLSPAGSPGLALRARYPFSLSPAPLLPPRTAALSLRPMRFQLRGGRGRLGAALREEANQCHRALL